MPHAIGIGNPGWQYSGTRHNIGFAVMDRVVERLGAHYRKATDDALVADVAGGSLVKPLTYVNRIGRVARAIVDSGATIEDLLVVVDDVNLTLGRIRMRTAGSSGGHNGLKDVEKHLESRDYARLRLGVGATAQTEGGLVEHVLGSFDSAQAGLVATVTEIAADAVIEFLDGARLSEMMGRYNRTLVQSDESGRSRRDDER